MLRPYQTAAVEGITPLLLQKKRVVLVLPTGAGKTFTFVHLVKTMQGINPNFNTVICVHREKLLKQAVNSFTRAGIYAGEINRETKRLPRCNTVVGMIETIARRSAKTEYKNLLSRANLLIIDEAHINNFNKLLNEVDCAVLGCTATPISAGKKTHMQEYYDEIFVGVQIPELVENGWLANPRTMLVKAADLSGVSYNKQQGDFDERQQVTLLKTEISVNAMLSALERINAKQRKAIMFNVNIEHNIFICDAFMAAGYNVFRVDSKQDKEENERNISDFAQCDFGVIMNVGILTTGYDQPDIDLVIINRKTGSIPLWLQMCGRGSRITDAKNDFDIVYVGDNFRELGLWESERDWAYMFNNPKKSGEGIAPIKECYSCKSLIAAAARVCKFCDSIQPIDEKPTQTITNVVLQEVSSGLLSDVKVNPVGLYKILVENKGRRPHAVTYSIIDTLVRQAKRKNLPANEETATLIADEFLGLYQDLTKFKPELYKKQAKISQFWSNQIRDKIRIWYT